MTQQKKKALGKGLEALFGDINIEAPVAKPAAAVKKVAGGAGIEYISIDDIKPNEMQPRKDFNEESIDSLAESIREYGLIQPVMLKRRKVGYELVAGERRWRAARKAGLKEIPSIIKKLSSQENALFAIIENMQREDLNSIEEANAYKRLSTKFNLTQEDIARSVGKSRPYVANIMRLLKLPAPIQEMIEGGSLSAGHANAIGAVRDTATQIKLAEQIVREKLSVRDAEKMVDRINGSTNKKKSKAKTKKSNEVLVVEDELTSLFGTKVTIGSDVERGAIEIHYYSKEELDGLIEDLRSIANTRK